MRLFHVSEEAEIKEFVPRLPARKDMDPSIGLVWAIDEKHLPNFLTPRNCPRVCFLKTEKTTVQDIDTFMGRSTDHVVVIEEDWMEHMKNTDLYLYEFDPEEFSLQDEVAGYYVSTKATRPIRKFVIHDLPQELRHRGVELRTAGCLTKIANQIKESSFDWSLCRMNFAKKMIVV